ncbi:MAG: glutamyl-tRNA reductase [Nitrospirae bacterium]|nr:glutamyl-tRNA reductase [Nitrospirota bacterium]
MHVVIVGLSHKTAPVEIREKLSFTKQEIPEAVHRLKSEESIKECLVLSTCNRVEIYAAVTSEDIGTAQLTEFFCRTSPHIPPERLIEHLYTRSSDEAVGHLFRVASGLDSMVVGEPQILGQVKESYDVALLSSGTGTVLNKLFKKAISVAKRVRTETGISENAVSVSYAAVELAKKIFGHLHDKTVMLLGAGEMAELAAGYLAQSGAREVVVSTRNYDRAVKLAGQFNGRVARYEDFLQEMIHTDIVLCSTGAPTYLIRYEDIHRLIQKRKNRPVFMIDISVPRNIDPEINEIDNVYLYDIDDLESVVKANLQARQKEAEKAEEIIGEEMGAFNRWMKTLEVVPTIVALREKAEQIRKNELDRVLSRLGPVDEEKARMIDALTSSIVNKILHAPMTALKDESNGSNYAEVLRKVFDLQPKTPGSSTPDLSDEEPTP